MSTQPTEAEAAVLTAVDTLMGQLEAEQRWIEDLRNSLEQSETRSARLLNSVEAAIGTLPVRLKRDTYVRLRQLRGESTRRGRPVRDGRQRTMLHFIAEQGEGIVSTADLRRHLQERGQTASPQYVSNQMRAWVSEGLLTRESHGKYRIDPLNAALRAIRFRVNRRAAVQNVRAELRSVQKEIDASTQPIRRPISDYVE